MFFWLCNIEYKAKLTPSALQIFTERTGSCLIGKAREIRIEFARCVAENLSNEEVSARISKLMSFTDISYFIHSLVVQETSTITIDEIQDALIHVGDLPRMETNKDKSQGYIFVLITLCNLISKEFDSLRQEKKL